MNIATKTGMLKNFAKIGKENLRKLMSVYYSSKREVAIDIKGDCSSCENSIFDTDNLVYMCDLDKCCKVNNKTLGYYNSIKTTVHDSNISAEVVTSKEGMKRLSKGAIKLYFLYHFLPEFKFEGKEVEGRIRKAVKFTDLASILNMSLPAVKTNHRALVELGFIYETNIKRNSVDVIIDGEHRLHYKKSEGGSGYIQVHLDFLKHLVNMDNVNELRTEISKVLWVDVKSNKKHITFNKDNLIKGLPYYIQKSKKIAETIINSKKSKFKIKDNLIDITAYKKYKDKYNELKDKLRRDIQIFLDKSNIVIENVFTKKLRERLLLDKYSKEEKLEFKSLLRDEENSIINDLTSLAIQFGTFKVYKALNSIRCFTAEVEDTPIHVIDNIGGYIRTLIRIDMQQAGALG